MLQIYSINKTLSDIKILYKTKNSEIKKINNDYKNH